MSFRRIAIVNRGEAATRLIHAAREVAGEEGSDLRTIALHATAERGALFVREADEAVCLDDFRNASTPPGNPYLDHGILLRALVHARADAVWPGWGFVAEDAAFVEMCDQLGVTFVGPTGAVMRMLGDKIAAKRLAEEAGVPVAAWSGGHVVDIADAQRHAAAVGFPLVIKAAAGGGGRGIRLVNEMSEIGPAFDSARAEAKKAFGDDTLFIERRVTDARHVEVQVIADHHGTVWTLGVRDCSVQRRNQKVIEESSSTALTAGQEQDLRAAAERLCAKAGYTNAGTVEFLYQPADKLFAFLEVNTRLQVEHPVTELTTGLDLVKLQLHVARGGRLEGPAPQATGHAMEARLNAEDPDREFAPAPGRIELFALPTGPGVRVDTGVAEGDVIPPEYDSMVAKVIAWGRDRAEARTRLKRALQDMAVVVRGGVTNKSFLLQLLDNPMIVEGTADTGWLDRATSARALPGASLGEVAVAVAAIDAYDADLELARAGFLASASRGRPEARQELGALIELTHRGQQYRVRVAKGGLQGWYRLEVDGHLVDVVIERFSRFRSRLTMAGETHRIVSFVDGPDHLVDVDGAAHRVSREGGGTVRAPAAAVVVSVLAEPGDVVSAGDRLLVVEAMKMEVAITATMAGRVSEVLVAPNVQVAAGSKLLTIEPLGDGDDSSSTADRLVFDRISAPAREGSLQRCHQELDALGSFVAGFDLPPEEARLLLADYETTAAQVNDDAGLLLRRELLILRTFADLSVLTRNRRVGDVADDAPHSPREHFRAYLQSLDLDREGLPERFRESLRRALSHYGIEDLDRTPQLEEALYWIFQAHQRGSSHLQVIFGLLGRLGDRLGTEPETLEDEIRDTLDRLIVATQLRYPAVGNLARTLRHRRFDRPLIAQARRAVQASARDDLAHLVANPADPDREARFDRLVASPQPLIPLFAEHLGSEANELLLEVMTRRYYKIRELHDVRADRAGDLPIATAAYERDGQAMRVVAARGSLADVVAVAAACAAYAREKADVTERVVIDLYLTADVESPGLVESELSASLLADLVEAGLPSNVGRVAIAVSGVGTRVRHVTYRRIDGELEEDTVIRGLHPMIANRLNLWRLSNFVTTRVESPPDVHLFDCVARDNPSDERLIAVAEVRDITPVRDADGHVTEIPGLEQVLSSCLDGLRRRVAMHPNGRSLGWNRVLLYVWPVVTTPIEDLLAVAGRLAPITDGLGLDQILVHCRVAEYLGSVRDVVVRVGNQAGTGLNVRLTDPPTAPLQPIDAYTQKVIAARRRGAVFPFEIVRLLTGDGGNFVEYDLDADGRLVPVDRSPGTNTAGVVVGVVRTPTKRYPEGMARVAIFGDPTKALGSIAEPECRRLLAAIDIAADNGMPIEWFALSAGAKIAMTSGSENLDWVGRVLRRLIEHTQAGGEVHVVVAGINVGAQPYWNAEATMLMHTKGILVMTPDSAMVLTGKQALDYAGGVSAEDNVGLGGFERIMGPNGQAQYWAPDIAGACAVLMAHHEHAYRAPGERFPRRAETVDPVGRDVSESPHVVDSIPFTTVGDIFSSTANPDRKKPFDVRALVQAVVDCDHSTLERWAGMLDAEAAVVFEAHLGGHPVCVVGVESRPLSRFGRVPADGPDQWSAGTLFPLSSKKVARALNAASGSRPVVILANLSGFDGSPESLRKLQLEYGAEIGRAVVNFDGPIVLCVVSRYHGGAFVVFSATLNDNMQVLAVEGSFASVIGGSAAAAVVFGGEVANRVKADPRMREMEARLAAADDADRAWLRGELAELGEQIRLEKLGEVGAEFDAIHSVERALEVGSVHEIVPAADLRPALIAAVERGMARSR